MDLISTFFGSAVVATTTLHLLFTGDIFLDRHIDELTQANKFQLTDKYEYPFTALKTLGKDKYDAWIGNLECPVTERQSTKKQKDVDLRFSCKSEYLQQLSKYFDVVSLANNHTDNMGDSGFLETKKHLDNVGIKYFGSYDHRKDEICKIIEIKDPNSFLWLSGSI